MNLLLLFGLVPVTGMLSVPFLKRRAMNWIIHSLFALNAAISLFTGILSLQGDGIILNLEGSYVTGQIPVRSDALSGWFLIIINLVFVTGWIYGSQYLKSGRKSEAAVRLHWISLLFQHAAITAICVVQNSLVMLFAWEILALSSFILIIFDHRNPVTIRSGINYLIQAHFSVIFLMVGFIWVSSRTGSYDFTAIADYASTLPASAILMLYSIFFIGFAIKAGFFPFHTWLPYAHPAAPSHVSGMMSGVTIKTGIYGILRFLLIIRPDFTTMGYAILTASVVSLLYGVMLAIVQHNIKKLLAYHSIENIGIIGIGIGIGCIGTGSGNPVLATIGYAGALLHTLNHALFKTLLFFAAGNVSQATHTLDIEKLGGVIRKMPRTAVLFLIASIAICGIPPFNGFISEFLLFSGLYSWLTNGAMLSLFAAVFTASALAVAGGLAMICFTKAFGIIFLGSARTPVPPDCREAGFAQLLPLYILALLVILVGVYPGPVMSLVLDPVSLFPGTLTPGSTFVHDGFMADIRLVNLAIWLLVLVTAVVWFIRSRVQKGKIIEKGTTWGCGYASTSGKQQYTASSYARSYAKLFGPVLEVKKEEEQLQGTFPGKVSYRTHMYDKVEKWLIDPLLAFYTGFLNLFVFLHNGKLQMYLLYGIIFVLSVLGLPVIYDVLKSLIDMFKIL